jgi:hypothetical protein
MTVMSLVTIFSRSDVYNEMVMNQSPAVGSKVARQPRDFSSIPEPSTPQGHTTRRALEIAHAVNDRGAISRLTAESNRLRPVERERACEALLLDAPCFHNNTRFLLFTF